MGAGKGVVDVEIAERRQPGREIGIVLLFFGVEAQVFEHDDVAAGHGRDHGLGLRPYAIRGEGHGAPGRGGQRRGHRTQRHRVHHLALGPAQVRGDHHLGPLVRQFQERRHRAVDARGVGDGAVLHGHVEVGAHQHPLAGDIEVVDGLELGHGSFRSHSQCGRQGLPEIPWRFHDRIR